MTLKACKYLVIRFLYSTYADDTTFFLRNEKSAIEVIKTFDKFSLFSGLKLLALVSKRGLIWHSVEWNKRKIPSIILLNFKTF